MKGEKTINEIAQLYEVHPNQVGQRVEGRDDRERVLGL